MITIQNINKSFGEKHVLKNVSAHFNKGQCNFVIGASGSGKSVMMKCMVGLIEVDNGEISYGERDFVAMDYNQKKEIRQEIGMLFQGTALFDSLNVEDNIAFPLRMFTKMSQAEVIERVNFCLKRVNLENVNKLFPSSISGGMKKRVGIARAMALNPKYLFCDEPNSGLDPITSRLIDELIKEITLEYDITTIINTHDMKSLFEMGDNIVFIHKGEKWWEGRKDEIRSSGNAELLGFMKASEF
ncbi:phosphonate ABC transporter ATP-binding protein [Bacteroidetes bacterium UKL13-3]|jgi:phospholipid/cholesterol/gamma-HCH transport system ATP-binding protein|nr:phosphonate ABC transporter ATP-binding protein [Bacteroidetes bacterium UKL13-3]HCP92828.1 ABC transporter ATP-binding protein [Bacteroidota bacterium]